MSSDCADNFKDAAASTTTAKSAAAAAALGDLSGSALLQRVTDRNKLQQFGALMRTRLAGKRFRLLYTWSSDGRSNASFHQRCDNQGPTLVVVRSTFGHTFGAYANAPWTSVGECYTNVGGCFLFLVENPHNDAPTCFDCSNTECAMTCDSKFGPTFGGGYDMTLHANDGHLCATSGRDYIDTLGRGSSTFTHNGDRGFTVEDYEVWAAESESEDSSELSMELAAVEVQASGSNFEGPNQTTPAVDTVSVVLNGDESQSEDSSQLSMELVAVEVQASGSNCEGPNQTTPAVDTVSAVLDIALDDAVAVEIGSRTGSVATEEEDVGVRL